MEFLECQGKKRLIININGTSLDTKREEWRWKEVIKFDTLTFGMLETNSRDHVSNSTPHHLLPVSLFASTSSTLQPLFHPPTLLYPSPTTTLIHSLPSPTTTPILSQQSLPSHQKCASATPSDPSSTASATTSSV